MNKIQARYIAVDRLLCAGCGRCELMCGERHYRQLNPKYAAIKVTREFGRGGDWITIETCRQCPAAWCMNVCPIDAIHRDEVTGALIVDEEECTGCGLCLEACPFGMIKLHSASGKAFKCDLCGGNPTCVSECPRDAITVKTSTFTKDSQTG